MKYLVFLLTAMFSIQGLSVHAEETAPHEFAFSDMKIQEEPFRDAGILYRENCIEAIHQISVSPNGKTAVAAGSWVNVYDENGGFLFGFYSKTDHSTLRTNLHDDWIEIVNSTGSLDSKYYAYQFDGELLCCAEIPQTDENRKIENSWGISDSFYAVPDGYEVNLSQNQLTKNGRLLYRTTNATYPQVHPEPEEVLPETPIAFDLTPVSEKIPVPEKCVDGNDAYAPLHYSVNSAGETLVDTGDYLHLYHPDGYYQQSFYLEGFSRKKPVTVLYQDCIQVYYQSENLLVTYDKTDGSVLSAGKLTDSEQNQNALKTFKARCFSEDTETENAKYWFSRNQLTRIQNHHYYILYQKQDYTEEQNFSRVYGIFFLGFGGMILINHLKDKKQQEQ